jgi:hypothetical protein
MQVLILNEWFNPKFYSFRSPAFMAQTDIAFPSLNMQSKLSETLVNPDLEATLIDFA